MLQTNDAMKRSAEVIIPLFKKINLLHKNLKISVHSYFQSLLYLTYTSRWCNPLKVRLKNYSR